MTEELEPFKLRTPSDVWATLRQLDEQRSPLDIELLRDPGKIWHGAIEQLDESSGTFYLRLPVPQARRLPAPMPVRLSRTEKQLKIQFDTVALRSGECGELFELHLVIPKNVYRIQRRSAFRISNCPNTPIKIRVSLDGRFWLRKNLHDVSVGGCSFLFEKRDMPLKAHSLIPHCVISIPDYGDIETALEVRTLAHPRNAPKPETLKAGCRFVNLPFEMEAIIQRYVNAAEHKQKTAI